MKKTIKITREELSEFINQVYECELKYWDGLSEVTAFTLDDSFWESKTNSRKPNTATFTYPQIVGLSIIIMEQARDYYFLQKPADLKTLEEVTWNKRKNHGN